MQLNAYQMLQEIRDNLDEPTAVHWSDTGILRKLNLSQRRLWMKLSMTSGDWFLASADLTPVNGVVTLPSDCAKPAYLEHKSSGADIPFDGTIRERRSTRVTNLQVGEVAPDVYAVGEYIEINQEGFTDQVTLWYDQRVPDLVAGTADTGSTTNAIVIAAADLPVLTDDYYNGVELEVFSGTGAQTRATITDYVASTRVLTVAGTFDDTSVYGTYTRLPQEAVPLMILEATLLSLAKPSANIDTKYFEMFQSLMREAKTDFENYISTRIKNSQRIRRDTLEL